jgi:hypothetical protein
MNAKKEGYSSKARKWSLLPTAKRRLLGILSLKQSYISQLKIGPCLGTILLGCTLEPPYQKEEVRLAESANTDCSGCGSLRSFSRDFDRGNLFGQRLLGRKLSNQLLTGSGKRLQWYNNPITDFDCVNRERNS